MSHLNFHWLHGPHVAESVMPRIHTGDTNIMHVNQDSVLRNLKLTTLGISSMLHMWDSRAERFVANGATNGRLGVILVDGKDEVISSR